MAKRMEIVTLLCVNFTILVCLVSCAGPIRINVPTDQVNVAPTDKKIPLNAGLYLSQVFRSTQVPHPYRKGHIYIGEALVSGTEKVLRNLFREVTVLDQVGNTQNSIVQNYDVIVIPKVEKFEYRHFQETSAFFSGHHSAQIAIKWIIVSPKGKEIYQTTILSNEIKATWKERYHPEVCIPVALNDQFQKAQEDIYSGGWWKKWWWKEIN